jgi:hypothetical protein
MTVTETDTPNLPCIEDHFLLPGHPELSSVTTVLLAVQLKGSKFYYSSFSGSIERK